MILIEDDEKICDSLEKCETAIHTEINAVLAELLRKKKFSKMLTSKKLIEFGEKLEAV